MDKQASDILMENVIFIIIVVLFFAIMFLFISRIGTNSEIYEQVYAKQIALLIDKAKDGTSIEMDISKLSDLAKKNRYYGEIIKIDSSLGIVNVRLASGNGFDYKFFNKINVIWNIENNKLSIKTER